MNDTRVEHVPHISETAPNRYVVVYGEEIIGTFTNLRKAIEKVGNNFTFTAFEKYD